MCAAMGKGKSEQGEDMILFAFPENSISVCHGPDWAVSLCSGRCQNADDDKIADQFIHILLYRRMLCRVHVDQVPAPVVHAVPRSRNRRLLRSRIMPSPDLSGKLKIKFW